MRSDGTGEPVVRLLYRVGEAALALGLSRAKVNELINSGALQAGADRRSTADQGR
jgi:hypothetical protein